VVDHDVSHHMLLHTVTYYSRNNYAGSFSFPWKEALTGVLSHLSLHYFDEEALDSKSP
jgi:hypothetical protein